MTMKWRLWSGLCLMLCLAVGVEGSIVSYTDEAAFNAAVGAMSTVDFSNEFAAGNWGVLPDVSTFGPAGNQISAANAAAGGLYGIGAGAWGNGDAMLLGNGSTTTIITFNAGGIKAVGLYLYNHADLDSPNAQVGITINGVENVFVTVPTSSSSAAGTFYGYIADDEITAIRFVEQDNPDATYTQAGLTQISYGVPEPATMSLLAMGGCGVLLRRRRK